MSFKPMNPAVKAAWVAALNSDEFTQGKHRLKRDDGSVCCLGVLCELYAREHDAAWGEKPSLKRGLAFVVGDTQSFCFPPTPVLTWAEIDTTGYGRKGDTDVVGELSGLNDGAGRSFSEIAAWIEANI